MTTLDDNEITRRTPVWEAMSELFVGKTLQDYDYRHIADVLNQSRYSLHELESILSDEVAPVFHQNLGAFAVPEMEGWNVEFIKVAIQEYLAKRPLSIWRVLPKRWLRERQLAQVKDRWLVVRQLLTASKSANYK